MIRFFITLLTLIFMAACAPRATVTPYSFTPGVGRDVPVFLGTTRERAPDGLWHETDRGALNFARIDVSIPPEHEAGLVELPGNTPDPQTDFLTRRVQTFGGASGFRSALSASLRAPSNPEREVVLFIHGFNNTLGDGVYRTAQMAHDLELPGTAVHYGWPSLGSPLGYAGDRDSALFARQGLEQLLNELTRAGARGITVVAHSMGSQLTMEVLRQMRQTGRTGPISRITEVVLMSPDIDVDVFRQQVEEAEPLPRPFVILTSSNDPALRLSARLSGQDQRLGNITDVSTLEDLDLILIDLSNVDDAASRHLKAASSPTLIQLFSKTDEIRTTLENDATTQAGLISGTVLLAQETTEVILAPAAAIDSGR